MSGLGKDTTQQVLTYMQTARCLFRPLLYLIGRPENPNSLWLTDWDAPVLWQCWGKFLPTVIKRDTITSKIGFDSQSTKITWSPKYNSAYVKQIAGGSPYQLANNHYYDNWPVRIWRCYMPTAGDAHTYGASMLWGGKVADTTVERGAITFDVDDGLDILGQQVPNNVVELLNTGASYTGATPPTGYTTIPQYMTAAGSSTNVILGQQVAPNAGSTLDTNAVRGGFLIFNGGDDGGTPPIKLTLPGYWSSIQQNVKDTVGGTDYDQFILNAPLPWPPTPGLDTFYVSGSAPINQTDGDYQGFPYLPAPELGV